MAGTITRFVSRVAVVMLVFGSLLVTASEAQALWTPDATECAFLREINAYRKANGLNTLTLSRSLSAAADNHSYYMATTDDVDHSLGGTSWSTNIWNYGYPTKAGIGENVLAGRQSAAGALALWKTSAAHNKQMLNRSWTTIGIGRVYKSSGKYDYYWTTTFGTLSHRTISC